MKQLVQLTVLTLGFTACKTKREKIINESPFQIILTDTTNNRRAQWDLEDFNYRTKLENQLGLTNLTKGSDSFEIRLWYDFSFSNSEELYVLKFIDTNCLVSFFRIYPRQINYDDETRNRSWSPYTDPIIDSTYSKTVCISNRKFENLNLDSLWLLKSQSALDISPNVGFTDCYSYIIEIADKKRLKYLRHHCPRPYYEKTKLKEILDFESFFDRVTSVVVENNAYVRQKFEY